jgi:hypothetical protein
MRSWEIYRRIGNCIQIRINPPDKRWSYSCYEANIILLEQHRAGTVPDLVPKGHLYSAARKPHHLVKNIMDLHLPVGFTYFPLPLSTRKDGS